MCPRSDGRWREVQGQQIVVPGHDHSAGLLGERDQVVIIWIAGGPARLSGIWPQVSLVGECRDEYSGIGQAHPPAELVPFQDSRQLLQQMRRYDRCHFIGQNGTKDARSCATGADQRRNPYVGIHDDLRGRHLSWPAGLWLLLVLPPATAHHGPLAYRGGEVPVCQLPRLAAWQDREQRRERRVALCERVPRRARVPLAARASARRSGGTRTGPRCGETGAGAHCRVRHAWPGWPATPPPGTPAIQPAAGYPWPP